MQDSDLVLVCVFGKCNEQSDSAVMNIATAVKTGVHRVSGTRP